LAYQRTTDEILADITAFRAARAALVAGERVTEVWRDGRRVIYAGVSLKDIDAALTDLAREYESAGAVEADRPRRRPIGLAWRN
jgi:hypothetical protein